MNEVPDALKKLTREDLFFPKIEEQKRVYTTVSDVVATVALWSIQQSPYAVPDNLEIVCKTLDTKLKALEIVKRTGSESNYTTYFTVEYGEDSAVRCLQKILKSVLRTIPEYLAWNERKNGNQAQLQFVSRYDGKSDPDNDFIDLDALERNVAMSLVQRYIIDSRDGYLMTPDGPVKYEAHDAYIRADINTAGDNWVQVTLSADNIGTMSETEIESRINKGRSQ